MKNRSYRGTSVVELLIATTITGMLSLAFLGILLTNFKSNAKMTVMADTMAAVRNVKERIGKDIREGRSLGDVYGVDVLDPASGMIMTHGSDQFPCSRDPIYGGNATPGVVTFPTSWPAKPYKLSNRCLIVQVPVTDDHADVGSAHFKSANKMGWPTSINPGDPGTNPAPTTPQDNVETHVYMVLPDPANPGQFIMQYASFPGYQAPNSGYLQAAHNQGANGTPQTILTGIIGPLDVGGNPKIFQYVDRVDPTGTPVDSLPNPDVSPNFTGVVVNIEVRKNEGIKNAKNAPIGLKLEVFLRNNALATSTGKPVADW